VPQGKVRKILCVTNANTLTLAPFSKQKNYKEISVTPGKLTFLAQNKTILWLLASLPFQGLIFGIIVFVWGLEIIDPMSDPELIRLHIEGMTAAQRMAHIWMTVTVDVVFPITYGAIFAGIALRSFPVWLALPGLTVIPVDLFEGVVQVLALMGEESVLWLKAYLTPMKIILFRIAFFIAAISVGLEIIRYRKSKS